MDSPFQDILNTNAVPSDEECQTIHELLAGSRKQSVDLTEQIARMQQSLAALIRKRDEILGFIDAHLALVSAVRRLPHDVPREIFVAALPSDRNCVISGDEPPFLCAEYVGNGELWHFHTTAVGISPRRCSFPIQIGGNVLRGQYLALSIGFRSRTAELDIDISVLIEAFIRYATRWKDVRITLPYLEYFEPFRKLSSADIPLLERVSMQGFEYIHDQDGIGLRSLFAFLETVALRSLHIPYPGTSFSWGLLRRLGFSLAAPISAPCALEILRQCPLLEICALSVYGRAGEDLPEPLCHMEYMQELRVTCGGNSLSSFFEKLVVPNLHCLEYQHYCDQFAVLPLFSSAFVIESLTLHEPHPIIWLVEALRQLPMFQELRLGYEPFELIPEDIWIPEGQIVALLTPGKDIDPQAILCPRLRRIQMQNVSRMPETALLEFIQVRTGSDLRHVAHLSSVRVEFSQEMTVDIIPPLRHLLAAGLEVSLQYVQPSGFYSPSEGTESHQNSQLTFSTSV
ncbi:hypothetical protein C8J57DRAFT_1468805 [Mycena rebaudengoi]|nr:hypothetical protein C8J57DRAFT_1468805 [Mycena rebaudengoi]